MTPEQARDIFDHYSQKSMEELSSEEHYQFNQAMKIKAPPIPRPSLLAVFITWLFRRPS